MKRATALVIAAAVIVAAGAVLAVWRSTADGPLVVVGTGPQVVVGRVDDFPVGSITPLDLEVRLTGYIPRVSETFGSEVVEVPIFLVSDVAEGFLALYAKDPHLGCRVGLASELPSDTGAKLPEEVVFLNPCHGEKFDRLGGYLAGPAPRGLDRFGVSVDGADVVVDVAAFEYGPDR